MIGMLVADEDGVELTPINTDCLKPAHNFTGGKTCIEQNLGPTGFDENRIAFAAAGKQANPHYPLLSNQTDSTCADKCTIRENLYSILYRKTGGDSRPNFGMYLRRFM